MNRNAVIGLVLVIAAIALAVILASSEGGALKSLLGKAVWYLPYVAAVAGLSRLLHAQRTRKAW